VVWGRWLPLPDGVFWLLGFLGPGGQQAGQQAFVAGNRNLSEAPSSCRGRLGGEDAVARKKAR
jgi:hypothetical protein